MKPTLIIIRHVDTSHNSDDKNAQRLRGHLALQPTAKGRKQARAMAQTLAKERIRAVYTSDLPQAEYGARAIAEANHYLPEVIPTRILRSWNVGELAGRQVKDVLPKLTEYQLTKPDSAPRGGEPFNSRLLKWFAFLRQQMAAVQEEPDKGAVVDVSHGRLLSALVGWLKNGMKGIEVDPVVWEKSESPVENGDALVLTFTNGRWTTEELDAGDAPEPFNERKQLAAAEGLRKRA